MPDVIKVAETTAGRNYFEFPMVDSSGNKLTGLTVTGRLIKDNADAVAGGTFAEKDAVNWPGLYSYTPSTAERATAGACIFAPTAAGALSAYYHFQIIGNDVYAASATAPTNFSVMAITGAGAVTAGTVSDKTGYALTTGERTSIAAAVWASATRTLTSFGTLASDVWTAATRSLTDKLGFGLTSAERTAIRNEMEGPTTTLTATATAATAIQAKTDNLPAIPAAAGSAMALTTAERAATADALLARNVSGGANGGVTVSDMLKGDVDISLDGVGGFTVKSKDGVTTLSSGTYFVNDDGSLSLNAA